MRLALPIALAVLSLPAIAADAGEGKRLVDEKRCETCHHDKTLGDAKAIYLRKDRKVNTPAQLKARVALCNSELNLQMFPDEEDNVAAFLDRTYYRFTTTPGNQ